jgi:hypothetical protein
LHLDDTGDHDPLEVHEVAPVATRWLAERHQGDLRRGRAAAIRRTIGALEVKDYGRWAANQRQSFDDLALLVAPIPGLSRWTEEEKVRLITLMRAKGAGQERRYARMLQGHHRLYRDWRKLARPQG